MKVHPFVVGSGALMAAALSLSAATPAPPPTTVSHTSQSSAEVEDIGVIGEAGSDASKDGKSTPPPPEKVPEFRFNFGARADYTSNAKLSGNHASNDFIFFPNLEGGYHHVFGSGFAFDSLVRLESGVYGSHTDRTFIGYSDVNTLEWRPKPGLPRIFIGAEPYRYDRFDGQGLITQAVGTSVGSDWGYSFNNGNSLFFVGYSYTDYFSDPEMDHRLTHSATVGFSQVLRPKVIMQTFYQYVHEFYPDTNDRQDSRHNVGVNVTYQINRHLFTTLSATFVDSDSTQIRAAYQSAGFSLALNYQY